MLCTYCTLHKKSSIYNFFIKMFLKTCFIEDEVWLITFQFQSATLQISKWFLFIVLQEGSLDMHKMDPLKILENHPTKKVKTKELLNSVFILYRSNVKTDLTFAEAIHKLKPQINAQSDFCQGTLSLFWHKLLFSSL